jgi:hypothetical protein
MQVKTDDDTRGYASLVRSVSLFCMNNKIKYRHVDDVLDKDLWSVERQRQLDPYKYSILL